MKSRRIDFLDSTALEVPYVMLNEQSAEACHPFTSSIPKPSLMLCPEPRLTLPFSAYSPRYPYNLIQNILTCTARTPQMRHEFAL